MKKEILGLTMILVMMAGSAHAFDVFLPPAGEDVFPATQAELMVQLLPLTDNQSPPMPMQIMCSGPAKIVRSDPVRDVIETEIVALELSCANGIMVRLNPKQLSKGQVTRTGDSFFDVFVEISVPGMGTLINPQPARVQSTIGYIPPLGSMRTISEWAISFRQ